jgi:AcrR family transcriptional regulator
MARTRAEARVNKELRKAEYLRAAARTFLAKGSAASMQDIADAAGAPKPVFYRIYPSRADLIDSLFQHVHDTILKTQQGKWDGYGWALRVLYAEARLEPEIFIVVLKVSPSHARMARELYALIHSSLARIFARLAAGSRGGASPPSL